MKAEELAALFTVADEARNAALQADANDQIGALLAAIAAVAPLIAAREREECADFVWERGCLADPCCDDIAALAATIRARGLTPADPADTL